MRGSSSLTSFSSILSCLSPLGTIYCAPGIRLTPVYFCQEHHFVTHTVNRHHITKRKERSIFFNLQIGPEHKGVEQSLTIVVSFHDTFITKVDRAFRCTCFYMEADRVAIARFDVR
ncbi:unnamed protein product [Gongylonema pulchrum]|uniref:Secreted protein n=1 Tax=Gongylonema pulchrum TaxID=637853 RepID=A0A183D0Y8_9BILA|nr:unnamed protein product [Gongylonema pulchrum]